MIVPLNPPLEGATAERFLALARTLTSAQQRNRDVDLRILLQEELHWANSCFDMKGSQTAYIAVARVLLDLVRLGWKIREQGYGVELEARHQTLRGLSPSQILEEKRKTQALFNPLVKAQLRDPAIQSLAQRLENPSKKSNKNPITLLIAEGHELHAKLLKAIQNYNEDDDFLAHAVQPYLQLVTSEGIDEVTGHTLREIWRYFRYTWSIPQFSTPGRQLLYLVRDAAHACHAVMGLIGLNNCALQMGEEREYYLGWNLRALSERLLSAANSSEQLLMEYSWMEEQIGAALNDVESTGLVSSEEMDYPTLEIIARLKRQAQEFDQLRDETLRELTRSRSGDNGLILLAEMENLSEDHPPVSEEVLDLDERSGQNPTMQKARRHLVARKRAAVIAELLHARLTLRKHYGGLIDPAQLTEVLTREEVGIALNTVLVALKSRYAGINMLEISTCGAIPPYQNILGACRTGN